MKQLGEIGLVLVVNIVGTIIGININRLWRQRDKSVPKPESEKTMGFRSLK